LEELAGIEPKRVPAYEAHVNGRVERVNRSVAWLIRVLAGKDPSRWPEVLKWAEFAMNSSVYSVTGQTPSYHITGYDSVRPTDCWREDEQVGEPLEEWRRRMALAMRHAELCHSTAADKRAERFNAQHKSHDLGVGDEVYVWYPAPNKLSRDLAGPFKLQRFIDPGTKRVAVLSWPDDEAETLSVHVDRLRKNVSRDDKLTRLAQEAKEWAKMVKDADVSQRERDAVVKGSVLGAAEIANEDFRIERILERKQVRDKMRYKVRFEGYGAKDDLWYDEDDLMRTMPEGVQAFNEQQDAQEEQQRQGRIGTTRRRRKIQGG
jgi:hypothetical protein